MPVSKHEHIILPSQPWQKVPKQHREDPERILQKTGGNFENLQIRRQWQRRPEPEF